MGLFEFLTNAKQKAGGYLGNALLGQQEPPTDAINIKGVDTTTPEYKENMAGAPVDITVSQNPRRGGILPDISAGYQENRTTPISVNNFGQNTLEDGRKKGFAYKLGEGLGSLAKFAESPTGRALLMGGLVGATGGSGLEALGYGATTGLTNQVKRTEDKLYRDELKKRGFDTTGFRGYVNSDTFKNLMTSTYRHRNLDQNTYTKLKKAYDEQLRSGSLSPEEYEQNMKLLNDSFISDQIRVVNSGTVGKSNATRKVDMEAELLPTKKEYLESRTEYFKNGGASGKGGKGGKGSKSTPIGVKTQYTQEEILAELRRRGKK